MAADIGSLGGSPEFRVREEPFPGIPRRFATFVRKDIHECILSLVGFIQLAFGRRVQANFEDAILGLALDTGGQILIFALLVNT